MVKKSKHLLNLVLFHNLKLKLDNMKNLKIFKISSSNNNFKLYKMINLLLILLNYIIFAI